VRIIEAELANRVSDALAPWLGRANIRVQVVARLNFVETEITRERARSGGKGSTERSVQRSREPSGRIERLSALVVVNEAGLPQSERQAPATQKKIQQLASQALGMDSQRRDSLQVVLLPFEHAPPRIARAPDPLPAANQTKPEVTSWAGAMALVVAALLVLGAVWQMTSRGKRVVQGEPVEPVASPFDAALETARKSVLADPARAASVIRLWVQS
jgi:flagellar biosynthesis/type III secretory pathway M-ring protein FliF/YscJ